MCMSFCYFERDIEVFSAEEGNHKEINGYLIGDKSVSTRRFRRAQKCGVNLLNIKKEEEDDEIKVPPPIIIEPKVKKNIRWFNGSEMPIVPMPEFGEFIYFVKVPKPFKKNGMVFQDRTE